MIVRKEESVSGLYIASLYSPPNNGVSPDGIQVKSLSHGKACSASGGAGIAPLLFNIAMH